MFRMRAAFRTVRSAWFKCRLLSAIAFSPLIFATSTSAQQIDLSQFLRGLGGQIVPRYVPTPNYPHYGGQNLAPQQGRTIDQPYNPRGERRAPDGFVQSEISIDRVMLGGQLSPQTSAQLNCYPSDKNPGLEFCTTTRGNNTISVYKRNDQVAYYSSFYAMYNLNESRAESIVRRFSAQHGPAQIVAERRSADGSHAFLLSWGTLRFEQVPTDQTSSSGIYINFPFFNRQQIDSTYHIVSGVGLYVHIVLNNNSLASFRQGMYSGTLFTKKETLDAQAIPLPSSGNNTQARTTGIDRTVKSSTSNLTGEWYGNTSCNGKPAQIYLTASAPPSGDIPATIAFYHDDNLAEFVTHVDMLARSSESSSKYRFVSVNSSEKLNFTATLNGPAKSIDINSNLCGAFTLDKLEARNNQFEILTQASYKFSNDLESRCQSLVNWVSRVKKEYNNIDLMHTSTGQLFPKTVLLFTDNSFIPAFGFPYDQAVSYKPDVLDLISKDILRECNSDPFARQDGMDFWGSQTFYGPMLVKNKQFFYNGQFSPASVVHFVEISRIVHRNVESKLDALKSGKINKILDLIVFRDSLMAKNIYYWPSEFKEIESTIQNMIYSTAFNDIKSQMLLISRESDQRKALIAIKSIPSTAKDGAYYNLRPSDRIQVDSQIRSLQHRFSLNLFASYQKRISETTNDFEDADRVNAIMAEAKEIIDLFPEDDAANARRYASDRINSILKGFVNADVAEISKFAPDLDGLTNDCKWVRSFELKFKNFTSIPSVRSAIEKFKQHRAANILGAFEYVKNDIIQTNGGLSELKKFLCWSGDREIPQSIQYDYLAAQNNLSFVWR